MGFSSFLQGFSHRIEHQMLNAFFISPSSFFDSLWKRLQKALCFGSIVF